MCGSCAKSQVLKLKSVGKKSAMKFDVEKMFEETRRSAREYTQQVAST